MIIMANILEILGSTLGKGLQGGVTTGLTAGINNHYTKELAQFNAELNQHYWEKQANRSFQLNEMAANNAMNRSIDLYNILQSPSAMVKQLKEAGLNPALMYSSGGMGGHTQSGPQGGANASAQGAPTLGLQNLVDPLTAAQIANINADTDIKKEEVKNVTADTALKWSTEQLNKQSHNHEEQAFSHKLAILIAEQALKENEQTMIPTKNSMTNKQLEILENQALLTQYEEELARRFKEKGWDLGSMTGLGSLLIQLGDKLGQLLDKFNIQVPEWMKFW